MINMIGLRQLDSRNPIARVMTRPRRAVTQKHGGIAKGLLTRAFTWSGRRESNSHDQLGRNLRAHPSRFGRACRFDLVAPRGTVSGSDLGPAKGPACHWCSIFMRSEAGPGMGLGGPRSTPGDVVTRLVRERRDGRGNRT